MEAWDNDGYHGPYSWTDLHPVFVEKILKSGKYFETFKPTALDFISRNTVRVIGDSPLSGRVRIPLLSRMYIERIDWDEEVSSGSSKSSEPKS